MPIPVAKSVLITMPSVLFLLFLQPSNEPSWKVLRECTWFAFGQVLLFSTPLPLDDRVLISNAAVTGVETDLITVAIRKE